MAEPLSLSARIPNLFPAKLGVEADAVVLSARGVLEMRLCEDTGLLCALSAHAFSLCRPISLVAHCGVLLGFCSCRRIWLGYRLRDRILGRVCVRGLS